MSTKVPALQDDESGEFLPAVKEALQEIFLRLVHKYYGYLCRYDKDKDGTLSEKELDDFAISCNGKPFDKKSKKEIKVGLSIFS